MGNASTSTHRIFLIRLLFVVRKDPTEYPIFLVAQFGLDRGIWWIERLASISHPHPTRRFIIIVTGATLFSCVRSKRKYTHKCVQHISAIHEVHKWLRDCEGTKWLRFEFELLHLSQKKRQWMGFRKLYVVRMDSTEATDHYAALLTF